MSLIQLFPTCIWKSPASQENFDSVNLEVSAAINHIKENDDLSDVSYILPEAAKRKQELCTDMEGYFISDDLIGNHNLVNLETRILDAVNHYAEYVQWTALSSSPNAVVPKLGSIGKWKIMNSWVNIGKPGVMHEYHCHPGYTIAGVYYHTVSEQHGGLCFNNPNQITYSGGFPSGRTSPQNVEMIPNTGDIILFPAWLQHGTMTNTADTDRISIAFNINWIAS